MRGRFEEACYWGGAGLTPCRSLSDECVQVERRDTRQQHCGMASLVWPMFGRPIFNFNFLSRSSQHMLLASQTLADLYKVIICPSKEIPEAIVEDGRVRGYREGTISHLGAVLCIEGVAYVIDPKAMDKEALYGTLDPTTREWNDGLFTHILRKIVDDVRGESGKRHWIIFDGDVDPEWVENLNR